MKAELMSRTCQIMYLAAALANLVLFFYFHGDGNNIAIAVLLGVLIMNQRVVDLWRGASFEWQQPLRRGVTQPSGRGEGENSTLKRKIRKILKIFEGGRNEVSNAM